MGVRKCAQDGARRAQREWNQQRTMPLPSAANMGLTRFRRHFWGVIRGYLPEIGENWDHGKWAG